MKSSVGVESLLKMGLRRETGVVLSQLIFWGLQDAPNELLDLRLDVSRIVVGA